MLFKTHLKFASISLLTIMLFMTGCATPSKNTDTLINSPQKILAIDSTSLKPGLAVLYFKNIFVRHLDALPQGKNAQERGWPGLPIPNLNHKFGRNNIFDSGTNRGLGMEVSGYIKFEQPGTYAFQANTNDGFRLYIDGKLLIDDPSWHSDRLSAIETLTITDPGWHPLHIRYFQRKGTATLQLFWQTPDEDKLSIVPPEVLSH